MGDYKYIMNGGLAFDEEKVVEKLRQRSKEGWVLDKVGTWAFRLKKGEAKEMIHTLEYDMNYDDSSYVELFEEAGWEVAGRGGGISFFKAVPGTTPLYTDKESHAEKYEKFQNLLFKPMIFSGIFAVVLLVMINLFTSDLHLFSEGVTKGMNLVIIILLVIDMFVLVPSIMLSVAFKFRRKKLRG